MSTVATLNTKAFVGGSYPSGITFGAQGQLLGTTYQGGGLSGGSLYEFVP